MSYSRRQLEYFGEPFGECATRLKPGGRIYGGGDSPSQPTSTSQTTTTIPDYAKPYVERMLGRTEALSGAGYQAYGGDRIAGFTPMQQQAYQGIANLAPAQQLGTATQMAGLAGQRASGLSYDPTSFANQYRGPSAYQTGKFGVDNVRARDLEQYQMDAAERVSGPESFSPVMAQEYINPYMQNVVDIQKREAQRQSDLAAARRSGQAAQVGGLGGSRLGIENALANRDTQQLMNDIQATGSSAAYQQGLQAAQQQFNLQQQGKMQAALANQAAGMTVGQQNLAARLGVQQLGAQQALQAQLANQAAAQQAQQMEEASRQYGYGQRMTAAQLAAQYGLSAQQAAEQSRQFGAQYGLQGIQQQLAAAQQLGQLGQTQFGQQKDILQAQATAGGQQQALEQKRLDQQYQDFINQRQYPYQQLAFMSDMLRGLPLSQYVQTMYEAPPSTLSQMGGLGLAAYGMFGNPQAPGRAEGGLLESDDSMPGLGELALQSVMKKKA